MIFPAELTYISVVKPRVRAQTCTRADPAPLTYILIFQLWRLRALRESAAAAPLFVPEMEPRGVALLASNDYRKNVVCAERRFLGLLKRAG